ncbi:MAG: hypothetical protein GC155_17295 [Alphaproteobacteria bacterium]|nr:hypothetical protein [Alphaproteobacteria bacterium]
MRNGARAALAVLAVGLGLCGAAVASDPTTRTWRKLAQVEDRYATFINQPGVAKKGDEYTVRLVVLYKPGAEVVGGKSVAWDEYPALTVNCMMIKAKRGVRIRHAVDGSVIARDDDETARLIDGGSNEDDIAKAKCDNQYSGKTFEFRDGSSWMKAARENMAYVARRAPK